MMDLDLEAETLPHQTFPGQRLSIAEKLRVLEAWDRAGVPSVRLALLDRLGISPEAVARWNKLRRNGKLVSNVGTQRSIIVQREQATQLKVLTKENEALRRDLARAEGAVEALGKASELLTALAKSSKSTPPKPQASMLPPLRRRRGK